MHLNFHKNSITIYASKNKKQYDHLQLNCRRRGWPWPSSEEKSAQIKVIKNKERVLKKSI